jgi:hypothetical protein
MATSSKGGVNLLTNGSADASGMRWPGGKAMLVASATWGGGKIKLQVKSSNPSATWCDVPNSTLSADGTLTLDLPVCELKVDVTTATAIYADLYHIPQ